MSKIRRALLVFIIILVQSALAVTVGVGAIYLSADKTIPPGVYAGDVNIGGLSKAEAENKLNDYNKAAYADNSLELALDGGDRYEILWSDFEATLDSKATVEFMHSWRAATYLPNLLTAYFGRDKFTVVPVIKFNEGKLREKLIELSKQIDREPINAAVYLENGSIVRKAETSGISMNVANSVEVIRKQIAKDPVASVLLGSAKNYEIQAVAAKVRLKDLNDIQQVLAEYSTDIIDPELQESIKLSAKAINGVILPAMGSEGSSDTFSFVDWLKKQDSAFENDNEGYDQVASTLYAAILSAGLDKGGITRLAHELAVEYIEPGLDAWISGNEGDLKFKNTFSHKLAIFADVSDGKLTISIAGDRSDRKENTLLSAEVVQRFDPPVVNVENKSLKPGEKITLSPGREGLIVNVFRNGEIVSTDKYEAVKAIVQIGPDTGWSSDDK